MTDTNTTPPHPLPKKQQQQNPIKETITKEIQITKDTNLRQKENRTEKERKRGTLNNDCNARENERKVK